MKLKLVFFLWMISMAGFSQSAKENAAFVKNNFVKTETQIPMRDGAKLFTAIYTPKDASPQNAYPFLIERTPYSCEPYGQDNYPRSLGPNDSLMHDKYIFVVQDVRGRYKSEGVFEEMTPHVAIKKNSKDVDESTDAFDTVDWLLKNINGNNGNAGLYGISYPGFYAAASLPNAHPAIKAVSPQAPVTDEFMGDDANHNGAFFLLDNFSFMNYFGGQKKDSGTDYTAVFTIKAKYNDAYKYFLQLGPLKNTNGPELYNNKVKIWNEYLQHDTYDDYWKARNIRTHLKNIKPAVLVVGGLFDAEDMFGAFRTYEAIEKQSPNNNNHLIMGPWTHGAWSRGSWTKFGTLDFGQNLNTFFKQTETDFFQYYLKNNGNRSLPEATVYNTGTNTWNVFETWPPTAAKQTPYYFLPLGKLTSSTTISGKATDDYISDPANPVPYTATISGRRVNEYLVDDQRFAAARKDVLTYQTDILENDVNVVGRVMANLMVSLQGISNKSQKLDADFVVKLVDVLPDNEPSPSPNPKNINMAGYQRLIRAEVFRGKFRKSFEKPIAFEPGKKEQIKFELNEMCHTFKKGHRIMVQIQSSWFPLVDINPQTFVKIPEANAADFQPISIKLHHQGSQILLPIIK